MHNMFVHIIESLGMTGDAWDELAQLADRYEKVSTWEELQTALCKSLDFFCEGPLQTGSFYLKGGPDSALSLQLQVTSIAVSYLCSGLRCQGCPFIVTL